MNQCKYLLYLLQTQEGGEATGAPGPGGGGSFLFVMLGMILIFYFLLIRPQMKEQKRRKAMLAAIKKHDKVLTTGGIYGVVVAVNDNEVTLKIDDSSNVRVKFARSAVSTILSEEAPEKSE